MNAPQWVISTIFTDGEIGVGAKNLPALKRDVRKRVAIAKLVEFENQAYRIGRVVGTGYLEPAEAAEFLSEVAICHDLFKTHGIDFIQEIIARGVASR